MRKLILLLLLSTPAWGQFVSLGGNGQPGGSALGLPEQWLMHDGSGSTFADATPNNNTITASNITWGTGTGVTSPTFNGTTSTAVAAQTAITDFDGTKPFSLSVWLYIAEGGGSIEVAVAGNRNGVGNGWGTYLSSLFAGFVLQDASGGSITVQTIAPVAAPNTPFNLILTYDGTGKAAGVAAYVNGASAGLSVNSDTLSGSTATGLPLFLGSTTNSEFPFEGSMSNLQIFSGVLTSGQIAAIQTAGP